MNILITSVGRTPHVIDDFKNALGGNGKVYASNSVMTSSMLHADDYVITPLIYDSNYMDFLLEYCQSHQISMVTSWFDLDIPVFAMNKERFKSFGITLLVPDEPIVRLCNDKWQTYHFLKDLGIKQPITYIDLALLKQDLRDGKIIFPLIIKPRWGLGSNGLYQVDTMDELDALYQKVHKIIFNSFMKYESEQDKDACIIMQEKIKGVEYVMDVFNDLNANYVTTVVKRKYLMRFGETYLAEIVENETFTKIGELIARNLKHISNTGVDCFLTDSGDPVVLEINPRFTGHYPFTHLAGGNFLKQIIDWLEGRPTSPENLAVKIGLKGSKELKNPVRF